MPTCEFAGESLNNITQTPDRDRRNTGTGLIVTGQRMPRCALLEDLGKKGPQALCPLVGFNSKQCPIAQYYYREISPEEANESLRRLGVSISLETVSKTI